MIPPQKNVNGASSFLPSFAPMPLSRRLADGKLRPGQVCHEAVTGAVMFADLSGFTTLAVRWGESGPSGAERLSSQLNAILNNLVDIVVSHGGEVQRFAGDAVIALWLDEHATSPDTAVARAAACALSLQQLFTQKPEQEQELELHIGIGAGPLHLFQTGGVCDQWHFIVGGDPMRQAARAEHIASPGQIALSEQAFHSAEYWLGASPLTSGHYLLEDLRKFPSLQTLAEAKPDPALVHPYVPASIAGRMNIAPEEWLAEFRRVSSLFIGLPDQWGDGAGDLQALQAACHCLQAVLQRYGGSLTQFLIDSKGLVGLAAWGIPSATHEDNANRAVVAGLALHSELRALGFTPSVGIATGRVFAGVLGNDRHRQYALHGTRINAAARLMQTARGGILCDEATRLACSSALSFQTADTVLFKGMKTPETAWRPASTNDSVAKTVSVERPLGRNPQCAQIENWLGDLTPGSGGLLWLEGEPGIGKTRLLAWLGGLAEAQGLESCWSSGEPLKAGAPYASWRALFLALYAPDDGDEADSLRAAVQRDLADDPARRQHAPLAGAVFPGEWPDNEATALLSGQVRADATRAVLTHLLSRRLADRQLLLVLDDGHWMDSSSWALVQEVHARVPQLAMVLASRPLEETLVSSSARQVRDLADVRLLLTPLESDAVQALVQEHLGVAWVEQEVLDLIHERAEGNPFFTEELLLALKESGALRVKQGRCGLEAPTGDRHPLVALPDTVEDVVLSRIDRRPEPEQLTLRIASVIGRFFRMPPLCAIHPAATEPELYQQLDALCQTRLTEADQEAAQWHFRHAITRDVAYELLTIAQRHQLHRRAAEFYQRWQHDPAYYPLLAHHWDRSEDHNKAREFLERAAEAAVDGGGHLEASGYLQRLLELSDEKTHDTQRRHWHRLLAQSQYALGNLDAASNTALHTVHSIGIAPPLNQAGWLYAALSQFARQLTHLLLPAAAITAKHLDAEALEEGALAAQCLAECSFFTSQPLKLITGSYLSVNLAERAYGRSPRVARSYALLGLINGLVGLHRLGQHYFRRSRQVARDTGDSAALGYAHHAESAYWCGHGDWPRASHHAGRALESAQALHDPQQFGLNQTLLAVTAIYTGEFEVATQRIEAMHTAARQRGNRQHEAWGHYGRAQVQLRQGDLGGCVSSCESAWALLQTQEDRASEIICNGYLALARAWRGEWPAARQAANRVLDALRHTTPTAFSTTDGFLGAGLALLAIAESGDEEAEPNSALAQVRWLNRVLWRFSRTLTIGRPALYLLRARLQELDGQRLRAARSARRAITESETRGMPFEACLGWLQLASITPAGSMVKRDALLKAGHHAKTLGNDWLMQAANNQACAN